MYLQLLSIVLVVVAWFYYRWSKVRNYWSERGVPYDSPHPLLGNMGLLMKVNPAIFFKDLYRRFPGTKYVGVWWIWTPVLVIQCPQLARRVLVSDFNVFCNRFLSVSKSDPIGHHNIFVAKEPQWSAARKKMSVSFTSAKLKMYQTLAINKTIELVKRIKTDVENKEFIDLRALFTDFSTDLISLLLFEIQSDATLRGPSMLRDVTKQFMEFNFYRFIGWRCIFFQSNWATFFRFPLFPTSSINSLRQIFKAAVAQRGGYGHSDSSKTDMVSNLMKMKEQDPDVPEDVLVAQAAILLQGGFDTTASMITFGIYELAFSPEAQEKLYEELAQAKKNNKDEELSDTKLSSLVYLDCVVKETLRKYSSMQFLDRIATVDYKLDDKLTIPAGTPVIVNAVGLQSDPELYPQPEDFLPDRFLPSHPLYRDNDPYTYMPFGEGPRHCIAKRLALQMLRHAISAVVLQFELSPLPGASPPGPHHLHAASVLLTPNSTLTVQFNERS